MSSEHSATVPATAINPRRLRLAGAIGLAVFAAIVVIGIATRISEARSLRERTDEQAVPTVTVSPPQANADAVPLQLPGRLEAYTNAPIYARISGYLKSWNEDIGARVKAGQLLGEIETPDLDQQIAQARADLASAKANAALAATTARRWQALRGSDSVAQQEVDERSSDYTAKQAQANAAQANLDRLMALKAFTRIVAPFDGTVTARNTDVGALINAGAGGSALFEVADTSKLRVYVRVPQSFAPSIHRGDAAELSVPEYPGQTFKAKVEADARAIAPGSGTTLVQLLVDNPDGRLLPGGYASVRFALPAATKGLSVPASALVFNSQGLRIATLGADDRVHFKQVTIRHDYGKTVELGSGLEPGDRVIESPPDGLADGDRVHIANNDSKAAAQSHEKA
jgi:RND family efflux transporter MFP subunit